MSVTQDYKKVTLTLSATAHVQVLAALLERERDLSNLLHDDASITAYWTRQLAELKPVIEQVQAAIPRQPKPEVEDYRFVKIADLRIGDILYFGAETVTALNYVGNCQSGRMCVVATDRGEFIADKNADIRIRLSPVTA